MSTGDYVNLTTPKIEWMGNYHFINELRMIIQDLQEEVAQYMDGKSAPRYEQQSLFEEDTDDNQFDQEEDL